MFDSALARATPSASGPVAAACCAAGGVPGATVVTILSGVDAWFGKADPAGWSRPVDVGVMSASAAGAGLLCENVAMIFPIIRR
ncbi:MAG: hypothetical protein RR763_13045 [Massilia sp.]